MDRKRPRFLYPETRHNSPRSLSSHLSSLPSISLPLSSPLLVTTATGEGQKTKGDEKCADETLSQLKNGKFLLRRGADLLHQLEHDSGASKNLMFVYFIKKPEDELAETIKLCQQGKPNHAPV